MIAVAYGAGTNSTAMLVGMHERGIRPDVITFADTGGELPETYETMMEVSDWCITVGFPEITIVQSVDRQGGLVSLEQRCLDNKMLPSIAYGYKRCSLRHKVAPQDKYLNSHPMARSVWKSGQLVVKYIGYDADEERRATIEEDEKYTYEFPLIEWGWGRDECVDAIARVGIKQPGKSACFFCPSMKQHEIRKMAVTHPEYMDRAIAMEENAELTSVRGLGRSFAWKDVIATDDMFPESYIEEACGCYDG